MIFRLRSDSCGWFWSLVWLVALQFFVGHSLQAAPLESEVDATQNAGETEFFLDLPVVLAPSRLEVSTESTPVSATIIDYDMIHDSGYTEVIDLMRMVPGMLVARWPQGDPTLASYGLGDAYGRRLLVMINGAPINNPWWGNVNWNALPIRVDDIERIEVVRATGIGLMNVNPFHGAINIITRDPATEDGKQVLVRAGSGGFYELATRIGSSNKSPYIWRMSASRRMMDTFNARTLEDGKRIGGERFSSNAFNFETTTWAGANDQFSFRLGASSSLAWRGFPSLSNSPEIKLEPLGGMPVHRATVRNVFSALSWVRSIEDAEYSINYSFAQEHLREELRFDLGERLFTRQQQLGLQGVHVLNPDLRMSWSLKLAHAMVNSRQRGGSNNRETENSQQVLLNVDWQATPKTAFDIGFNARKVNTERKVLLSPRLGVRYAIDKNTSIGLGSGISWRTPNFAEQNQSLMAFASFFDDDIREQIPRLEAEKMRYISMDYKKRIPQYNLILGTRAFYERYQNYIQTIELPFSYGGAEFIRTYNNSPEINIKGIELTAKWMQEWGQVNASQVFSSIRGQETQHIYAKDIRNSAPHSMTTVQIVKKFPRRWQASLNYYRISKMRWLDQGGHVNTENRIDLHLSKGFGRPSKGNEISLSVHNLGRSYSSFDMRYHHVPRVFLSLNTKF